MFAGLFAYFDGAKQASTFGSAQGKFVFLY
jgi:hypothetical protein